ncbi:MAG: SPASM domain-containing protein, partial [Alphaproteobacteria bacterium]
MIKAPHLVKLAVALTDRCNLKCFICTREEFEGASGSIGRNMALEDFYKMEDALAEAEVGLHYVVHRDNLTEMSDFVRLGKSVDAGKVEFNHFMVNRIEHIDYGIYFQKERYNALLQDAIDLGLELGLTVTGRKFGAEPEQKFDPNKDCNWPSTEAIVFTPGQTTPCCNMGAVNMGNALSGDFNKIWNGKAYRKLRRERWMPDCHTCNLFQTFDDWRSHFHALVKQSPRFEELAGKMAETVTETTRPRILVLGAGRDGTRSVANLIANLHAANGAKARVMHEVASFRTFAGVAKYLQGDDEWMRNICRAWDADIIAGGGFNFILPLLHEMFGGDLKVIHLRREAGLGKPLYAPLDYRLNSSLPTGAKTMAIEDLDGDGGLTIT